MKKSATKKRGHKRVPFYWWDFGKAGEVIVESDDDRFPVVARFKYPLDGGQLTPAMCRMGLMKPVGDARKAIDEAERYIADLRAGRVTPRAC